MLCNANPWNCKASGYSPPSDGVRLVLAPSHFIKTVEDVSECLANRVPGIKFGIAFCEAGVSCQVRHTGNDREMEKLATDYMINVAAGHGLFEPDEKRIPNKRTPALERGS